MKGELSLLSIAQSLVQEVDFVELYSFSTISLFMSNRRKSTRPS